ncbi:MAG: sugar ABC transporter permease, partial [Actinomycetota bacterium]|nr:sugar ABC transporter permease [Actinomycetota bacterium]
MLASRRRRGRPTSLTPYLFLAPAGIYLFVLMGYPLLEGVRLSVTDTTLLQPRAGAFIGTDNYVELLGSPEFLRTLSITLVYTAASVLGAVGIGLLAALGMNRMTGRFRLLRGLV